MDVERFWFPGVFAGDADVAWQLTAQAEAHWTAPEATSADEVFSGYRAAIERTDAVLATAAEDPGVLLSVNLPPGQSTSGRTGDCLTSGTS